MRWFDGGLGVALFILAGFLATGSLTKGRHLEPNDEPTLYLDLVFALIFAAGGYRLLSHALGTG